MLETSDRQRNVYVVYGQNVVEKKEIDQLLQAFGLQSLTRKEVVGLIGGSSFIGDMLNVLAPDVY